MYKSKYTFACVPLVLAALVLTTPAMAQTQSGLKVYQEQLRVRLDEQRPATREVGFDAGGWFNFAFFNFDDSDGEKHRSQAGDRPGPERGGVGRDACARSTGGTQG